MMSPVQADDLGENMRVAGVALGAGLEWRSRYLAVDIGLIANTS